MTADLTSCEKLIALVTVVTFVALALSSLYYYIAQHIRAVNEPSMSITEHMWKEGVVAPFNLTFFPQLSLDLTETWNAKNKPACPLMAPRIPLASPLCSRHIREATKDSSQLQRTLSRCQTPNRAKISPFSGHLPCFQRCFSAFWRLLRAPRSAFPASLKLSKMAKIDKRT